jgi:ubiquitin carboxyl-terminal hydrolase 8
MLTGGFDAWRSIIGERGVYSYAQNNRPKNTLQARDSDQNVPLSPVKVHQTLYDYVMYITMTFILFYSLISATVYLSRSYE